MCLSALVSSPHVAVVYHASALALRLVVTPISASSFLHEAVYQTTNRLLVAVDLHSFPTAHCRVTGDSHLQHADDVGCVCTCFLEREPRTIFWTASLYILQASTCPVLSPGANGFRRCADLVYCAICAFLAICLLRYTSAASFGPVCSAELEAVFGIYDRITVVHRNPHAQCF